MTKQSAGTGHTLGPWEHNGDWRVMRVVRDAKGTVIESRYICDTANNHATRTPENRANASLIASAPRLRDDREGLLRALKLALTKLAHKPECMTCNPADEWQEKGSWSADKCCCEIAIVEKAIADAEREP